MYLDVVDTLTVNGHIRSEGGAGRIPFVFGYGQSGGGAGGSINVRTGVFAGSGLVTAQGGTAYTMYGSAFGGGGAGGRVALRFSTVTYAGRISVIGGRGFQPGGSGSVYFDAGQPIIINEVRPNQGSPAGGASITIRGLNFQPGATVLFGGTPSTLVDVYGTSLTALVPSGTAGVVSITVTNPSGESFTVPAGFHYTAAPMTALSAAPSAALSDGGTMITINGSGFIDGAQVYFDGFASPFVQFLSPTSLVAQTPPARRSGKVEVKVVNPGGAASVMAGTFDYLARVVELVQAHAEAFDGVKTTFSSLDELENSPTVRIWRVQPQLSMNSLRISGIGFGQTDYTVQRFFGSNDGVNYSRIGELWGQYGPGGGPTEGGLVTIDYEYWVQINTKRFRYFRFEYATDECLKGSVLSEYEPFRFVAAPAPSIVSVTPQVGSAAGGTPISILGAGFQTGAAVTIGGAPLGDVVVQSSGLITGVTPPGSPGAAHVVVTNPDGQSATLLSGFSYNDPPLIVTVPTGDAFVDEGQTLVLSVQAFDLNSLQTVGLALLESVPNASLVATPGNPAMGTFTFSPDFTQAGSYTFTFAATDDGSPVLTSYLAVNVTVDNVNQAPVMTISPSGTAYVLSGGSLTVDVTGADPDAGDTVTLTSSPLPANATFVSNPGNPAGGTLTFNPSFSQTGTFVFTFTGTDNGAPPLFGQAVLTVVVSAAPGIGVAPSSLLFTMNAGGTDPAPQPLTVSNIGSPGTVLSFSTASSQPWLSAAPASGSAPAGQSVSVSVSVNGAGLVPSTYSGVLTVSDPAAPNSPKTVPVTLIVGASGSLSPADFAMFAGMPGGISVLAGQTLQVKNGSGVGADGVVTLHPNATLVLKSADLKFNSFLVASQGDGQKFESKQLSMAVDEDLVVTLGGAGVIDLKQSEFTVHEHLELNAGSQAGQDEGYVSIGKDVTLISICEDIVIAASEFGDNGSIVISKTNLAALEASITLKASTAPGSQGGVVESDDSVYCTPQWTASTGDTGLTWLTKNQYTGVLTPSTGVGGTLNLSQNVQIAASPFPIPPCPGP